MFFSNYVTLSIVDGLMVRFYIHNDLIIRELELDIKNGILAINLTGFSLPDEITEIYNIVLSYEYKDYSPEKWLNKDFVADLMKKYPKAFKTYHVFKKIAEELKKNYGLNAEIKIIEDGFTYISIVENIVNKSLKDILILVDKVLHALNSYYSKKLMLSDYADIKSLKEDPSDILIGLIHIAKNITKNILTEYNGPSFITISNYRLPPDEYEYLSIEYLHTKDKLVSIDLSKENTKYKLEVRLTTLKKSIKPEELLYLSLSNISRQDIIHQEEIDPSYAIEKIKKIISRIK